MLSKRPTLQHSSVGLRALLVEELGSETGYFDTFRKAGFGGDSNDRARIARLAELFPEKFDTMNPGLGSMRVLLVGAPVGGARPVAPRAKGVARPR